VVTLKNVASILGVKMAPPIKHICSSFWTTNGWELRRHFDPLSRSFPIFFISHGSHRTELNHISLHVRHCSSRKLQLPCDAIRVQCESKSTPPLKLFALFSLRLSLFPWIVSICCPCISTHVYQFWSIYYLTKWRWFF